jgi:GTP cyclohydrolase I
MNKLYLTWEDVMNKLRTVDLLNKKVYGVPNGGMIAAGFLNYAKKVYKPEFADIILDDIIDSGGTQKWYKKQFPDTVFHALFDKQLDPQLHDQWVVFPWEAQHPNGENTVQHNIIRQLQYIGEDVNREGLLKTPDRVVKMWGEIFSGYDKDAKELLTTFDADGYADHYDEIVLLKDIEVYSMCEHHMLPFFGKAHVAYIPGKKIVGISKLARLVDMYARRLQIQERIGDQVTSSIMELLEPKGAACIIEATHMCMRMRGVQKQNSIMTTSSMKGAFLDKPAARNELMELIRR